MMIEKGIPIPPKRNKLGKWSKIALEMAVGDSVLLKTQNEANALWQALGRAKKTARVRIDPEGNGYRVWREA